MAEYAFVSVLLMFQWRAGASNSSTGCVCRVLLCDLRTSACVFREPQAEPRETNKLTRAESVARVSAPRGMAGPLRAVARRVAGNLLSRPVDVWSRANLGTAAAASHLDDDRKGLFALPGLHEPSDFARLARRAVARSDDLMRGLVSSGPSGFPHRSATAESTTWTRSRTPCARWSTWRSCRNVHPDLRWVRAAENAYVELQGYVQGLNSNRGLYLALVNAQERHGAELSPEAARVALTLRQDFERGGIHLGGDEHARLEKTAGDVVKLGMAFQQPLRSKGRAVTWTCRG